MLDSLTVRSYNSVNYKRVCPERYFITFGVIPFLEFAQSSVFKIKIQNKHFGSKISGQGTRF